MQDTRVLVSWSRSRPPSVIFLHKDAKATSLIPTAKKTCTCMSSVSSSQSRVTQITSGCYSPSADRHMQGAWTLATKRRWTCSQSVYLKRDRVLCCRIDTQGNRAFVSQKTQRTFNEVTSEHCVQNHNCSSSQHRRMGNQTISFANFWPSRESFKLVAFSPSSWCKNK